MLAKVNGQFSSLPIYKTIPAINWRLNPVIEVLHQNAIGLPAPRPTLPCSWCNCERPMPGEYRWFITQHHNFVFLITDRIYYG